MDFPANLEIDVHLPPDGAPHTLSRDVRDGLSASPKQLPSKYFYDERGSLLFEQITQLPEYYLTRSETALLERHAAGIARLTGFHQLVELGSGAARKIRLLIDAGLEQGNLRRYVPVEVSQDMVERSARKLAEGYPELEVHALVGDFETHLGQVPHGGGRLIALLGSTIGNFGELQSRALLSKVRSSMKRGDWLLLGTDLVKDRGELTAAYNDSQGVTAQFNLNILDVINRLVGGNFDPGAFDHVATYNEERSRIESYLRSTRDQTVRLDRLDLTVGFRKGELMRTEISTKYTRESAHNLLGSAGLKLMHWFTDARASFALSLSRP